MKIMLVYRPTPEGRAAAAAAREQAQLRGASIVAVRHVKATVEQPVPAVPTRVQKQRDPASQQEVAKLRSEMEALRDDLRSDGLDAEALLLTEGEASEAILDVARSEEVELIVVGIRRRSPVGKLLLGSLPQDLLLHADCAVLAVKAPD